MNTSSAGHDRHGPEPTGSAAGEPAASEGEDRLSVRPFEPGEAEAWDALVRSSCNGTFIHTRLFLGYHGDRFIDRSLVLQDEKGRLRAVLPAATDPTDPTLVVSHPGLTYGGLVHDGSVRGERMVRAFADIARLYREEGTSAFRYRAIPDIYHRVPAQDDLYALFRLSARRYRCDLSATIDLENRLPPKRMRLKRRRRAAASGVTAEWGWNSCAEFWRILEENLMGRFGASPAHTLREIDDLATRFPDEIRLVVARIEGAVIAGGIVLCAPPVLHLQYSSANDVGREMGGLDVVVEASATMAVEGGYRYYSFGNSNEDEGWRLNEPLYEFKLSFGAGAVVYEDYEIELASDTR